MAGGMHEFAFEIGRIEIFGRLLGTIESEREATNGSESSNVRHRANGKLERCMLTFFFSCFVVDR